MTFALIYHAIQILPLLVVGLVLEHRLVLGHIPGDDDATREPARVRSA